MTKLLVLPNNNELKERHAANGEEDTGDAADASSEDEAMKGNKPFDYSMIGWQVRDYRGLLLGL